MSPVKGKQGESTDLSGGEKAGRLERPKQLELAGKRAHRRALKSFRKSH